MNLINVYARPAIRTELHREYSTLFNYDTFQETYGSPFQTPFGTITRYLIPEELFNEYKLLLRLKFTEYNLSYTECLSI